MYFLSPELLPTKSGHFQVTIGSWCYQYLFSDVPLSVLFGYLKNCSQTQYRLLLSHWKILSAKESISLAKSSHRCLSRFQISFLFFTVRPKVFESSLLDCLFQFRKKISLLKSFALLINMIRIHHFSSYYNSLSRYRLLKHSSFHNCTSLLT